ncbi:hypothetical protein ANCDUO_08843 [Ancylostoma duodenale]|uniref:Phosphoglycerate mutase family protein n=1 Tax=Ancylostoma duodenale TaxID=51022 RepID=A0A0C2GIA2_9BILA|nr:hypothetical protein ANCDUO_08843 [Ancylostoma duodenale]
MGAEFSHLDYASDPVESNTNEATSTARQQVDAEESRSGNKTGESHEDKGDQFKPAQPKYYNIEDIVNSDMDTMVDVTDKEQGGTSKSPSIGRKIAVVRHAESMNEAFPKWYSTCVSHDNYTPKDLNHPVKLPMRSKGLSSYSVDPPITRLGKHASRILGKALVKDTPIKWESVISAPELASAQTAAAIAFTATGDKSFITIDETLYDFSHGKINFMTAMELMKLDITVKVSNPIKSKESTDTSTGAASV